MNSFNENEFLHLHKTYGGFKTKKNTYIETNKAIKKDSVSKQLGIKKTSNAKKTTSHKLETQINAYSNMIGDCSAYALGKKQKDRECMDAKRASRKKLKAK